MIVVTVYDIKTGEIDSVNCREKDLRESSMARMQFVCDSNRMITRFLDGVIPKKEGGDKP